MNSQTAVLKTLAYHDIFNYPLKVEEIKSLLIENTQGSHQLEKTLDHLILERKIGEHKGYFFLKDRKSIVALRLKRTKYSKAKLKKAKFFASTLSFIPTVCIVGISGALSMENADKNDDIDLVIITSKNTLWVTRLMSNIILQPFRRKAGEAHTKDKACLNLFLEENSLKLSTQNLYIAHEIAQMRPIWQRRNAYSSFLKANTWVKNFLPNWKPFSVDSTFAYPNFVLHITYHISLFEKAAKVLQIYYMRKRITTEKVGKHQLYFHPNNTQKWVLKEYQKRLKNLRIF